MDLSEDTNNGNLSECYLFGRHKGLNMTYGIKKFVVSIYHYINCSAYDENNQILYLSKYATENYLDIQLDFGIYVTAFIITGKDFDFSFKNLILKNLKNPRNSKSAVLRHCLPSDALPSCD